MAMVIRFYHHDVELVNRGLSDAVSVVPDRASVRDVRRRHSCWIQCTITQRHRL
jgi:hypothetical protein